MPLALFAALAGSLAIHFATLFGADLELFGNAPTSEQIPLRAELQPLPQPAVAAKPQAVAQPASKPKSLRPSSSQPVNRTAAITETVAENAENQPPNAVFNQPDQPLPPARSILQGAGVIRFAIYKESLGLQIGRAEHRWEFYEDGSYRLNGVTETSGIAAVFKPVRLEIESKGKMVAGGLQPDTFRSFKNGKDANENADFSWSTAPGMKHPWGVAVTLSRDGSVRPISPGTQDILSLNYQLAYLGKLAEGASIGVVTGKKYERYALDSLGEEEIEVPAGKFRTLHLRVMTDNVTEIWIALDDTRLPVKIRFTDKKGESFEQVATEIGMP
jgi:hypothetical protein